MTEEFKSPDDEKAAKGKGPKKAKKGKAPNGPDDDEKEK
jgi:hypothetical protein